MDRIEEIGPARETLDAEVVVIGAGVAGGLMAYELARRKHSVTILEAGPAVDRVEAVRRFRATASKGANSHCHTLQHEDMGMMQAVQVMGPGPAQWADSEDS